MKIVVMFVMGKPHKFELCYKKCKPITDQIYTISLSGQRKS